MNDSNYFNQSLNTSFGMLNPNLLWNTSEIGDMEDMLEEPMDSLDFANRYPMVTISVVPEVGLVDINNNVSSSLNEPEQMDEEFVLVEHPTLQTESISTCLEDSISNLNFVEISETDNIDNVWQVPVQVNTPTQKPLVVEGRESRKKRCRVTFSPSRSEFSIGTPSYTASEATDSTFVPDIHDHDTSESSFDIRDEFPSPFSTPLKSKKPRGRPPLSKTPKPKTKAFRTRTNSQPIKKIKLEQVSTVPLETMYQKFELSESFDDYFNYYGWVYSEYDDLAPVDQIKDACMYLSQDPVFFPLEFFFNDPYDN